MICTLISRNETGEMKQKWYVDLELDKAAEIAYHMFTVDNSNRVEIFEGRVPKGDFWGLPIKTVERT